MAMEKTERHAIDPLAEQAATLLAKAIVTSHDRDELWQEFRDRVVQQARALEEAPVREALEDMERRGLSLDVVARVVHERLGD
jgi:TPP-dependent pyruvate/acetoin dehydrogenase alpha subunit